MIVTPKTKEIERLFRRLSKVKIDYTDDIHMTRKLGRNFPDLFDEEFGFLDIGRIEKRNKSMIALRPNVVVIPKKSRGKYLRFEFNRIF